MTHPFNAPKFLSVTTLLGKVDHRAAVFRCQGLVRGVGDAIPRLIRKGLQAAVVVLTVMLALVLPSSAIAANFLEETDCQTYPTWPLYQNNDRFTMVRPGDTITVTFTANCARLLLPPQNGDGTYPLVSGMSLWNLASARLVGDSPLTLTFVAQSNLPYASFYNGSYSGDSYVIGQYRYSSASNTGGDGIALSYATPRNTAPTISGTPTSVTATEDIASAVDLSAAAVADVDGDTLTVTLGVGAGTLAASSGGNVTVGGSGTGSLTLTGLAADINTYLATASNIQYTTALDAAGNGVATLTISATDGTVGFASDPTVSINADNTPDVLGVTSSTANGHYKAGDVVSIQVTFDEAVLVTGTPTLRLETGTTDRSAIYTSGSGTASLTFSHTVQVGDTTADLDYTSTAALALNGGTIRDSSSYNADLALASPGAAGSLAANKAIVIDTTSPVVTDGQLSISGATGTAGVFKVGDTVTASWVASNGDGDTNLSAILGSVKVDFSAFGGGSAVSATKNGSTWSATYTIVASTSTTGTTLNASVTATDAAGNATTTADTSSATVDATPPASTATNIALSGASGTGGAFKIGDTVTATWDNTVSGDNNTDIDSVSFDFTQFAGGAAVTASNSGDIWTATYTIAAGVTDLTGRNVSVTPLDASGNTVTTSDDTNAVVDDVAPTVTAGAIAVSGATGNPTNTVFKIGDTVTVTWDDSAAGDNNADTIDTVTVDFSAFGGSSAITAVNTTGTWSASYTIPAGTLMASALRVTATATDNAGNVTTRQDDTDSSIDTVQTSQPAALVLDVASNTGSTSDTITSVTRPTISGTSEANATIDIYVGGTLVATTTADGNGAWSYTFTSDLAEGSNSVTTTATDFVGNTSAASEALVLIIDTIAPAQPSTATLDAGSNGGATNDLLTNDATPLLHGSAEPNSTVEIFVGGVSAGTATVDGNGEWSFELAAGALSEGNNTITFTAKDASANISPASPALLLALDTNYPTLAITDPLMADNRFNAAEAPQVTLSGTTTAVEDGQIVSLAVTDGNAILPFTAAVSGNTWTATVDLSALSDGALTITADVADLAGNAAAQAQHSVVLDTNYPTLAITDPLMADNRFNAAETPQVTLSGTTTAIEDGQIVSLTVSDGVTTLPFTTAVSGNSWTTTVDLSALSDGALIITADVADLAGNAAAQAQHSVALDTNYPTLAITDPLMADNRFNADEAAQVTLSGTTTAIEDGQIVSLTVSDGVTTLPFTTAVSGNTWTTTVDLSALSDGALTITADVADLAGNAAAQAQHSIAMDVAFPSVTIVGPTELVSAAFEVTITFSEPVYGFELSEVTVSQGTATALSGSGTTYTATIDPVLGQTVQVSVAASVAADVSGNPNTSSNAFEVPSGSPESAFVLYQEDIKAVLVDEAARSLQSSLASNQRMTREARGRFIAELKANAACAKAGAGGSQNAACGGGLAAHSAVDFGIDGGLEIGSGKMTSNGTFFGQTGSAVGGYRRLVFGNYDIQHDSDTGSTTVTLNGKMAWERMISNKTMLGYFMGGELAHSSLDGGFSGAQDRLGVSVGGYGVQYLGAQLYADGFVSFGAGRNNLEMTNDVLTLDGIYTTHNATVGAALSGVYDRGRYEFRPELAVSYGKTWIGTVDFTGRAYGLVDDTLSMDAGNFAVANLTLRPAVVWALEANTVADSLSQLSFAPRVVCERTIAVARKDDCGAGAEVGLSKQSKDGLSSAEFRVIMDRVGTSQRSSVTFNLQHRF